MRGGLPARAGSSVCTVLFPIHSGDLVPARAGSAALRARLAAATPPAGQQSAIGAPASSSRGAAPTCSSSSGRPGADPATSPSASAPAAHATASAAAARAVAAEPLMALQVAAKGPPIADGRPKDGLPLRSQGARAGAGRPSAGARAARAGLRGRRRSGSAPSAAPALVALLGGGCGHTSSPSRHGFITPQLNCDTAHAPRQRPCSAHRHLAAWHVGQHRDGAQGAPQKRRCPPGWQRPWRLASRARRRGWAARPRRRPRPPPAPRSALACARARPGRRSSAWAPLQGRRLALAEARASACLAG